MAKGDTGGGGGFGGMMSRMRPQQGMGGMGQNMGRIGGMMGGMMGGMRGGKQQGFGQMPGYGGQKQMPGFGGAGPSNDLGMAPESGGGEYEPRRPSMPGMATTADMVRKNRPNFMGQFGQINGQFPQRMAPEPGIPQGGPSYDGSGISGGMNWGGQLQGQQEPQMMPDSQMFGPTQGWGGFGSRGMGRGRFGAY